MRNKSNSFGYTTFATDDKTCTLMAVENIILVYHLKDRMKYWYKPEFEDEKPPHPRVRS